MAKIIKLTDELIEECKTEFAKALESGKMPDGKFTFTKQFDNIERKATIYFEEKAWIKMQALISKSDKEIGWHGLAKRMDDEDSYLIYDIIVYPQMVTGVTVNTDRKEYDEWLLSLSDEEFDNLRMQGHSHVGMATNPSPTDDALYESILAGLNDTAFQIFLIWNKRNEHTAMIYDMAENIFFGTKDIEVKRYKEKDGLYDFLDKSFDKVKENKPVAAAKTSTPSAGKTVSKKKAKRETPTSVVNYGGYDYDDDNDWRNYYYGRNIKHGYGRKFE